MVGDRFAYRVQILKTMTNFQFRVLLIIMAMFAAFVYCALEKAERERIDYNLEFHSEIKDTI